MPKATTNKGTVDGVTTAVHTEDGDGTDDVQYSVYGKGTPTSSTNTEKISMMYDAGSTQFEIRVEAGGSGTQRNLKIMDTSSTAWATFTAGGGLHPQ